MKVLYTVLQRSGSTISTKILTSILLVSSFVTFFMTIVQLGFDYRQDLDGLESTLSIVEKSYSDSISASLWELHDIQLASQLKGIVSIPGINYVKIVDNKNIKAEAGEHPKGTTISRSFMLSFKSNNKKNELGELVVVASLDNIYQRLFKKIIFIFFTQLVKTFLISFLIYLIIQHILTRHLLHINKYLTNIDFRSVQSDLTLNRGKKSSNRDELDQLVFTINMMRDNLLSNYNELSTLNQELEKRVEEKTNQLLQQRQRVEYSLKMSALGGMAGGMAHEINNPLAIIINLSQMLSSMLEDSDFDRVFVIDKLKKIEIHSDRITKIIKALRFFSRTAESDLMKKISINSIWNETLELCRVKFNENLVDLRVAEFPKDDYIFCRSVEISQVLFSLLDNAFSAISCSQEKWIHFSVTESGDMYLLTLTDSGAGIPLDIRNKIFEPFFTTKEVGSGVGIGLSVSKGIIEVHGGTLELDINSIATKFVIMIPKYKIK